MASLKLPSGTSALLNTRASASQLVEGRVYWLSDTDRLAVATGLNSYVTLAYDFEGLPAGGGINQVLTKNSNNDYDFNWATLGSLAYKYTINNSDWSGAALSLGNGGTGQLLSNPGGNRLLGWNNTAGGVDWITTGSTGISIGAGTISLVAATQANMGAMSAADKTKLDGLGTAYTDEEAQDAVGTILGNSATVAFNYNDTTPSIVAAVQTNSITDMYIRQSAGLSVIGRASSTTGNVADITAGTNHQVLRRSGTTLGFGAVNLAQSAAVTGTLPVANGGTGVTTSTGSGSNVLGTSPTIAAPILDGIVVLDDAWLRRSDASNIIYAPAASNFDLFAASTSFRFYIGGSIYHVMSTTGLTVSGGVTATGASSISSSGVCLELNSTNSNTAKLAFSNAGTKVGYFGADSTYCTSVTEQNGIFVRFGIGQDGSVYMNTPNTTASAANLYHSGVNQAAILRSTSSERYKLQIEPAAKEYIDNVLKLQPIWYRSNSPADDPNHSFWGLSAEEVAKVDPRLVHFCFQEDQLEEVIVKEGQPAVTDENGKVITPAVNAQKELRPKAGEVPRPDGVQYERVAVLSLGLTQRHHVQIRNLIAANLAKDEKIKSLEDRIAILEQAIMGA